nr:MAG TPA: hypothetical protein [Caudoviricetes sp.]
MNFESHDSPKSTAYGSGKTMKLFCFSSALV